MSCIFSFSNQKGGVGKTTTTINVGAYMAYLGKRVLMVDLDPQGNMSSGWKLSHQTHNVFSLLLGESKLDDSIISLDRAINPHQGGHLSLIPCTSHFSRFERLRSGEINAQFDLKKVLRPIFDDFDIILLDCPPSLGLITLNAFSLSNFVFVPIEAHLFSMDGLDHMCNIIKDVREFSNPGLAIGGIFFVKHDKRKILNREIQSFIANTYKGLLLNTTIRENIALKEAPHEGKDIFSYAPKSNGAKDYSSLTLEILNKFDGNTNG